jgi:2-polyprenyl-6-hydroxyphenyl methylase / 3-demethylubiquinone-9 3-methyltransferase
MVKMPTNNQIYDLHAQGWWDPNHFLYLLKTGINPARFGYFHATLTQRLLRAPQTLTLLDIGCGGGLLSEEFARLGCHVTGLDPSEASLETARRHAARQNLEISYQHGRGEALPFAEAAFDVIVCCDVLEHVDDLPATIRESARVLKPGGIYFFDTINRTEAARVSNIFAAQQFPLTAFFPPDTHVWEKFITPEELTALLAAQGLEVGEMTGLRAGLSDGQVAWLLLQRKLGLLTFAELGRRLQFQAGGSLETNYLGWAVKKDAQ